jgi:ubiquinone/menaquinone biosynthesis C-methylase UbiE
MGNGSFEAEVAVTMDQQFAAASAYESDLVPALMQAWAPRLADAAGISAGDRVLDVACGTGVLTRAAAAKAAPDGVVTGLDLDPGMLAVAARINPELRWQRGRAIALPFADATFDAVVRGCAAPTRAMRAAADC